MLKKVIFSGIVSISILLTGCNEEPEVIVLEDTGIEEDLSPESIFFSELHNEIILSVPKQAGIDSEKMSIFLGGNLKMLSVSVSFPKDVKVDDTLIQQIVEDSIKKVSEKENVTVGEEELTIKIGKF